MGRTGSKAGESVEFRPKATPDLSADAPLGEGAVEIDAREIEIRRLQMELEQAKGLTERPEIVAELSDDIASRASFISALAARSLGRAKDPDGGGLITGFGMEDEAARCFNLEGDLIAWTDMDKQYEGADLVVLKDPSPALAEFLEREEVSVRKGEPVWGPSESPLPKRLAAAFKKASIRIQMKTSDAFSNSRYGIDYEIVHKHRFGRLGTEGGKIRREKAVQALEKVVTHMDGYDRTMAVWYQGHGDAEGDLSLVAKIADIPQEEVHKTLKQILIDLDDSQRTNPGTLVPRPRIREIEEQNNISISISSGGALSIACFDQEMVTPKGKPAERWCLRISAAKANLFVHGDDLELHGGWNHKPPPSDRDRVRNFLDKIRETENRLSRYLAGEKNLGKGGWERSIRTTRDKLAGIS